MVRAIRVEIVLYTPVRTGVRTCMRSCMPVALVVGKGYSSLLQSCSTVG